MSSQSAARHRGGVHDIESSRCARSNLNLPTGPAEPLSWTTLLLRSVRQQIPSQCRHLTILHCSSRAATGWR